MQQHCFKSAQAHNKHIILLFCSRSNLLFSAIRSDPFSMSYDSHNSSVNADGKKFALSSDGSILDLA